MHHVFSRPSICISYIRGTYVDMYIRRNYVNVKNYASGFVSKTLACKISITIDKDSYNFSGSPQIFFFSFLGNSFLNIFEVKVRRYKETLARIGVKHNSPLPLITVNTLTGSRSITHLNSGSILLTITPAREGIRITDRYIRTRVLLRVSYVHRTEEIYVPYLR